MKNVILFAAITAALVWAYFQFYVKDEKPVVTAPAPPKKIDGETLGGVPVIKGTFKPVTTTPNAGIDWSGLMTSNSANVGMLSEINVVNQATGGTCASLPPNMRDQCELAKLPVVNAGMLSGYTGNGSLELYTGNGATELYTGNIAATVKPSCFSLWINNVNNPNGPLTPVWPGLNCRNTKVI